MPHTVYKEKLKELFEKLIFEIKNSRLKYSRIGGHKFGIT